MSIELYIYLIDFLDTLKLLFFLGAVVLFIVMLYEVDMRNECKAEKLFLATITFVVIAFFIPSSETTYKMLGIHFAKQMIASSDAQKIYSRLEKILEEAK